MAVKNPTPSSPDTARTRKAYDRAALWYDAEEWLPERLAFRGWRRRLWDLVPAGDVLEVGVGTGRNFPYYRNDMHVTAIDLSPKMLRRAEDRAKRDKIDATLSIMDAQNLEFEDASFDSAVASFVFCSVPDPVQGLREVSRVLRPGGRAYLLEHVLSRKQPVRWVMQRLNGLVSTIGGANINRDTVVNVEAAGFNIVEVRDLWSDVVKLIVAEKAALA